MVNNFFPPEDTKPEGMLKELPNEKRPLNYDAPLSTKFGILLENGSLTDVTFLVGEEKAPISAHKIILALNSPVFMTMFYGTLVEPSDEISIPDCDPKAFGNVILNLYGCDVEHFSNEKGKEEELPNVLAILYIAHKYDLKLLEKRCSDILERIVKTGNRATTAKEDIILTILSAAEMFNLAELEEECLQEIRSHTAQFLETTFQNIHHDTMLKIVKDQKLNIAEIRLFHCVNRWAESECQKKELSPTGENKREILQKIINFIRFPTMEPSIFAEVVVPTEILTMVEVAKILVYICTQSEANKQANSDGLQFPTHKRMFIPRRNFKILTFEEAERRKFFCQSSSSDDSFQFDTDTVIETGRGIHSRGADDTRSVNIRLDNNHNEISSWNPLRSVPLPPEASSRNNRFFNYRPSATYRPLTLPTRAQEFHVQQPNVTHPAFSSSYPNSNSSVTTTSESSESSDGFFSPTNPLPTFSSIMRLIDAAPTYPIRYDPPTPPRNTTNRRQR